MLRVAQRYKHTETTELYTFKRVRCTGCEFSQVDFKVIRMVPLCSHISGAVKLGPHRPGEAPNLLPSPQPCLHAHPLLPTLLRQAGTPAAPGASAFLCAFALPGLPSALPLRTPPPSIPQHLHTWLCTCRCTCICTMRRALASPLETAVSTPSPLCSAPFFRYPARPSHLLHEFVYLWPKLRAGPVFRTLSPNMSPAPTAWHTTRAQQTPKKAFKSINYYNVEIKY